MTSHEQIPSFLAEMPEAALASYLNPEIVPKPLPSGLARVMPWRDELLPDALQEYVRMSLSAPSARLILSESRL